MSLVPIAALGDRYGVETQTIKSIIHLACIVHQTDYWRRGRTLDKMGIGQLSVGEVVRYVYEGGDALVDGKLMAADHVPASSR